MLVSLYKPKASVVSMLKEMVVNGLALDPLTKMPIILLKERDSHDTLPIWIGLHEAQAIAIVLENIEPPRPMTHDLLKNIIEEMDARLERIVINDLRENTYYAHIELWVNNAEKRIDSRPSDAIALALRFNAPIFVESKLLSKSKQFKMEEEGKTEDEKLQEWLRDLRPEDFGKYKM